LTEKVSDKRAKQCIFGHIQAKTTKMTSVKVVQRVVVPVKRIQKKIVNVPGLVGMLVSVISL